MVVDGGPRANGNLRFARFFFSGASSSRGSSRGRRATRPRAWCRTTGTLRH